MILQVLEKTRQTPTMFSRAGVKLANIVKLSHLTHYFNNVETCVINMIIQNLHFGFCQTFQRNKFWRNISFFNTEQKTITGDLEFSLSSMIPRVRENSQLSFLYVGQKMTTRKLEFTPQGIPSYRFGRTFQNGVDLHAIF